MDFCQLQAVGGLKKIIINCHNVQTQGVRLSSGLEFWKSAMKIKLLNITKIFGTIVAMAQSELHESLY